MPFNPNCPGCGGSDPCGCSDPYSNKVAGSNVKYTGPNLPSVGVNTCDDLNTVLQKIDYAIGLLEAVVQPTTSTTTTTTIQ